MRIELHPDAIAEFRAAALWHEERRTGLSSEFVAEVGVAMERISSTADSFPPWPGVRATASPIRRAVLQRFPYAIAFETREQTVFVLAVAHGKRRPLYWLSRAVRRQASFPPTV